MMSLLSTFIAQLVIIMKHLHVLTGMFEESVAVSICC